MKRSERKRFILHDKSVGVYANFEDGRITFEEDPSKAVVFDERDNMQLKIRTYNTLTGLNFEVKELQP